MFLLLIYPSRCVGVGVGVSGWVCWWGGGGCGGERGFVIDVLQTTTFFFFTETPSTLLLGILCTKTLIIILFSYICLSASYSVSIL